MTYNDLTREQLARLHQYAHGGKLTTMTPHITHQGGGVIVQTGGYLTVFEANGNINIMVMGQHQLTCNQWKIYNLCRVWGIQFD